MTFLSKKSGIWGVVVTVVLVGAAVYLFWGPTKKSAVQSAAESDRALAVEGYLGAESCKECHRNIYATWEKSSHAHAMAIASPETVKGNFVQDTTYTYDGQHYRMFTRNNRYFIEAPNRDGIPKVYEVLYILGARQHENYLTRFPDGRIQVLPIYYNLVQKRWYDAAEGTLEIGKALGPDQFYFWANAGRTWNRQCFDCHASQMRKHYNLEKDTYNTTIGDLSINCETCHGPGAVHVKFWRDAAKNPALAQKQDRSLVKLNVLSPRQQAETCAQCHALKAVFRSGYLPGDDFQDYYELFLINSSDFYWPDGLSKKLAYPFLQFASSECFRKAGLTCTGCHASHGSDRHADLVADPGKVGLCARCHPEIAADVNGHTHHSPTGAGGDCNGCHLPQQFRNQLVMTDHRITVPVPENTVKLGIPNACNQSGCHADKSAQWTSDWSVKWYGHYQDARVAQAQAIDRGRKGDVSAVPPLIKMLTSEDNAPLLRAGVAAILGTLNNVAAVPALISALSDTQSAVRAQAAAALGRIGYPAALLPLANALSDSIFAVRIRAAYALSLMDYVPIDAAHVASYNGAIAELQSVVSDSGLMADDPNMHLDVGQIYEERHEFHKALQQYQYTLRFAPGLADAQKRTEDLLESESQYQKLVKLLTPMVDREVRAQVALGLVYVHRGKVEEGIKLLNKATDAGVHSELVETGLGDAYRYLGQFDAAAKHYQAALNLAAEFPGAHRGLALLAYEQGDADVGRRHWSQFVKARGTSAETVRSLFGVH